ncbi:unnamed protein product [Rangifer tarandus platyrhynchus]|uniref:Uncharacterized protein n=1 Tax=Rangifer tarandus platyrhynchus TaxID=3082113 RepID=A0ABN8XXF1_RANTA|nr:unnamed protein product [Rangifer tarandus platyrhynchus]
MSQGLPGDKERYRCLKSWLCSQKVSRRRRQEKPDPASPSHRVKVEAGGRLPRLTRKTPSPGALPRQGATSAAFWDGGVAAPRAPTGRARRRVHKVLKLGRNPASRHSRRRGRRMRGRGSGLQTLSRVVMPGPALGGGSWKWPLSSPQDKETIWSLGSSPGPARSQALLRSKGGARRSTPRALQRPGSALEASRLAPPRAATRTRRRRALGGGGPRSQAL